MNFWKLLQDLTYAENDVDMDSLYEDIIKIPGVKFIPIGNFEGSYAAISNLNTKAVRAVAEIIKNGEDHTLIRACLEKGIDPTSPEAPQTTEEASAVLFGVPEGDLSKIEPNARKVIFKNKDINVFFTGRTKNKDDAPSICIIDSGEGINGADFPSTVMSLNKSNKRGIPFVLGEFGQGSHSVSRFCKYRLIVSRRPKNIGGDEKYAFSFIKKFTPENDEGRSWWGYLTIDGQIPSVEKKGSYLVLPVEEKSKGLGKSFPYKKEFEFGTFVKLYSYDLPRPLRTNGSMRFYYDLIKYFTRVYVPFRVWETRADYQEKAHTNHRPHYGLNARYMFTSKEKVVEGYPRQFYLNLGAVGKVQGLLTVFNHAELYKTRKSSDEHNISDPIVFSINGMHHGALSNDFFMRRAVDLPNLKDLISIDVDLTQIPTRHLETLLMTDRERVVKDSRLFALIEDSLTLFLAGDEDLKFQDKKRYQEIIQGRSEKVDKDYQQELRNMISRNPFLRQIFKNADSSEKEIPGKGIKVLNPKPEPVPFVGTGFPSFLIPIQNYLELPVDRKKTFSFKTDLANGLDRRLEVASGGGVILKNWSLFNGKISCSIEPQGYIIEEVMKNLEIQKKAEEVVALNQVPVLGGDYA